MVHSDPLSGPGHDSHWEDVSWLSPSSSPSFSSSPFSDAETLCNPGDLDDASIDQDDWIALRSFASSSTLADPPSQPPRHRYADRPAATSSSQSDTITDTGVNMDVATMTQAELGCLDEWFNMCCAIVFISLFGLGCMAVSCCVVAAITLGTIPQRDGVGSGGSGGGGDGGCVGSCGGDFWANAY